MDKEQRKAFLSLILKRIKKGSGSSLHYLMEKGEKDRMRIPFEFEFLVCGARAANLFMPPRFTQDWDLLVPNLEEAETKIKEIEASYIGELSIGGSSWEWNGMELTLI